MSNGKDKSIIQFFSIFPNLPSELQYSILEGFDIMSLIELFRGFGKNIIQSLPKSKIINNLDSFMIYFYLKLENRDSEDIKRRIDFDYCSQNRDTYILMDVYYHDIVRKELSMYITSLESMLYPKRLKNVDDFDFEDIIMYFKDRIQTDYRAFLNKCIINEKLRKQQEEIQEVINYRKHNAYLTQSIRTCNLKERYQVEDMFVDSDSE